MDDDRSSDYLAHREAIRQENLKRIAVTGQQRRKVARVRRVGTFSRIVMALRVGKWVLTAARACLSAVDVEREEPVSAGLR